jgi:hypothetical protein
VPPLSRLASPRLSAPPRQPLLSRRCWRLPYSRRSHRIRVPRTPLAVAAPRRRVLRQQSRRRRRPFPVSARSCEAPKRVRRASPSLTVALARLLITENPPPAGPSLPQTIRPPQPRSRFRAGPGSREKAGPTDLDYALAEAGRHRRAPLGWPVVEAGCAACESACCGWKSAQWSC